eukprot:1263926-Prymnesium_polylepis.1
MRTVAHSGLPQRCQAARSRQDKYIRRPYKGQLSIKSRRSLRRRSCAAWQSETADAETAAEQTAHASLL